MISLNKLCDRRAFIAKGTCSAACLIAGSLKMQASLSSYVEEGAEDGVATLSGMVEVSKLGTTLMHEHVLFGNIPGKLRSASMDVAVKLMDQATAAGVKTIVDVTPYRNIHLYRQIADKTSINIIASTGYYTRSKMPSDLQNHSEAGIEKRMYKEVTAGIDDTTIKAGIIKIAADNDPLNDWEKKVFRAAARVQKETKIPIATHAWTGGRAQFDFLVKCGIEPRHINFGHIETVPGWKGKTREQMALEFLPIVQNGGYLLFNNFSCEFYTPWKDMVYLLKYYCDKGFSSQVLISEDCNWEWKNSKQVFEAEEEHPDAAKRTYAYMMTHEIPVMLESGFSKKDIQTFMVHNPRKFFQTKSN